MTDASIRGIDDEGKFPRFDASFAYPPRFLERLREASAREAARAGMRVEDAITAMSRAYTRERGAWGALARTDARYVGGYFFVARDLPKAMSVAFELVLRGAMPPRERARVLDLGCGLGTTSFGLARVAHQTKVFSAMHVDAVDSDAGVLGRMRALAGPTDELVPMSIDTHEANLEGFLESTRERYDVVLLGLALNELDDESARVRVLGRALDRTADDGVVLVIEPALHATSRALMAVRDRLVTAGTHVLVPCTHAGTCPMLAAGDRDWCHAELELELPDAEAELARRAGLRDERPTFAPLVLARAESPSGAHRLVSRPLGRKGKTEAFACGQSGLVRLRELDRDAGVPPLGSMRRGSLISLEPSPRDDTAIRLGRDAHVTLLVP